MRVIFFTIVLDGMPWVTMHYPVLRTLKLDWEWWVMEGVAEPVNDTKWVRGVAPRLSEDGTTEYLRSLEWEKRVHVTRRNLWRGKTEMVNYPLMWQWDECLLWQLDSDELWTAQQIETCANYFDLNPKLGRAEFWCRYFVGPDIVTTVRGAYGNHPDYEWRRVWRYQPGARFTSHEPPRLEPCPGAILNHQETEAMGLVFDHYAYALESQAAFKDKYYPYGKVVESWRRLQANQKWPVKLKDFFHWADVKSEATRI